MSKHFCTGPGGHPGQPQYTFVLGCHTLGNKQIIHPSELSSQSQGKNQPEVIKSPRSFLPSASFHGTSSFLFGHPYVFSMVSGNIALGRQEVCQWIIGCGCCLPSGYILSKAGSVAPVSFNVFNKSLTPPIAERNVDTGNITPQPVKRKLENQSHKHIL